MWTKGKFRSKTQRAQTGREQERLPRIHTIHTNNANTRTRGWSWSTWCRWRAAGECNQVETIFKNFCMKKNYMTSSKLIIGVSGAHDPVAQEKLNYTWSWCRRWASTQDSRLLFASFFLRSFILVFTQSLRVFGVRKSCAPSQTTITKPPQRSSSSPAMRGVPFSSIPRVIPRVEAAGTPGWWDPH